MKERIIPASGKPADLDLDKISTVEEADRVIFWLSDVIKEMERQLAESKDPDADWLRRVRGAKWWAIHIRHKAREVREGFEPSVGVRQAVASVILDFLTEDDVEELEEAISERFPHLTGVFLYDALK